MLALAYAAAHPHSAGPIVLVGCGTFDPLARPRMQATLDKRMDDDLRYSLDDLAKAFPAADDQLTKRHALPQALYTYASSAAVPAEGAGEPLDVRAHTETWADMMRLQEAGVYPAAFAAITSPVLMLHGMYDLHPGHIIRASLTSYPHTWSTASGSGVAISPGAKRTSVMNFSPSFTPPNSPGGWKEVGVAP